MMNRHIKNFLECLIYQASSEVLGKVRKFNNIHKGESCYIFGDGISLKSMDLHQLSDKCAIACNYVPFHKEFVSLNCSYGVVSAPLFHPSVDMISLRKSICPVCLNCIER